jgi:hypothetical protein
MRKHLCKLYLLLLISLFCQSALSLSITGGLWWDDVDNPPSSPGRGFTIEQSENVIVFIAYLYTDAGDPLWYLATLNENKDVPDEYTGTLNRYNNGQTATGSYKQPKPTEADSKISLKFSDSTHAKLNWFNTEFPIVLFESSLDDSGVFKSGLWWNDATSDEGGRGFSLVEAQTSEKEQIILTSYLYDEDGNPLWYQAILDKKGADQYSGQLNRFSNGQTATGSFIAATSAAADENDVSLVFTTATKAKLRWFNTDIQIAFFEFGDAEAPTPAPPPDSKSTIVRFITSLGNLDIELNTEEAGETSKNFVTGHTL